MEKALVRKLAMKLKQHCPVDSGALLVSISSIQGSKKRWLITIGNESGKEINGKCATVEYAAITNFAQTISIHGKAYNNPNYHWVNKAVREWLQENKMILNSFNVQTEGLG